MSSWQRRVALAAIRITASVMPASRQQWADAMQTEMSDVKDDREALDFAMGCLWTSAKERVKDIDFGVSALNVGIPAGLLMLALLGAHLSGQHLGSGSEAAPVFGLLSVVFTAAAILFIGKGARAFSRLALALVPAYFVILALLYLSGSGPADVATSSLYKALAVEGVAIWSTLFLCATFLVRKNRIAIQADRRNGS